jgi:hypothetical protein
LGARNPRAKFPPIADGAELYRKTQAIVLKWNTGLYTPEQIKNELQLLVGDPMPSDIPDGVLVPNNEFSLGRTDIDMDMSATVPSPGQGQDNGAGSLDGLGMDLRSDTIQ